MSSLVVEAIRKLKIAFETELGTSLKVITLITKEDDDYPIRDLEILGIEIKCSEETEGKLNTIFQQYFSVSNACTNGYKIHSWGPYSNSGVCVRCGAIYRGRG